MFWGITLKALKSCRMPNSQTLIQTSSIVSPYIEASKQRKIKMVNYNITVELAKEIVEADEKLQTKWVKAESARQRKRINSIKKLATTAKRELVAKDAQ